MSIEEQFNINTKHVGLRTVAFLLALLLAVGAISFGVTRIGRKVPGYQSIDIVSNEEELSYARDISFQYYLDGSSDEIKRALNEIRAFYSPTLLRVCKLLDAETEYDGMNNLATLNARIGQDTELSEELFRVLLDAQARSEAQTGYNLFSGKLNRAWLELRYLSEPEDFDPLRSEEQRQRLDRLCEACRDRENFKLTVVDAERHLVRFEVSESCLALFEELEAEGPILDLGALHDAYELQLTAKALEEKGYRNGFLSMKSGATILLSGNPAGELQLYGKTAEGVTEAAVAPAESGRGSCVMRAFAQTEGEPGYYEMDGHLRHPWLPASGAYSDLLLAALVVAEDPVTACCRLLELQEYTTAEELLAAVAESGEEIAVILNDGAQTVCVNSGIFSACEEYGWRLELLG